MIVYTPCQISPSNQDSCFHIVFILILKVTSVWFKLYLYHMVGSGPPSLLLVKGTRLRRLPKVFEVNLLFSSNQLVKIPSLRFHLDFYLNCYLVLFLLIAFFSLLFSFSLLFQCTIKESLLICQLITNVLIIMIFIVVIIIIMIVIVVIVVIIVVIIIIIIIIASSKVAQEGMYFFKLYLLFRSHCSFYVLVVGYVCGGSRFEGFLK